MPASRLNPAKTLMTRFLWGFAATLLATVAHATGNDPAPKCRVTASSDQIAIVLCAKGLKEGELADIGGEACGLRTGCNAWIWDDPDVMPKTAPKSDAGIAKAQAAAAVAVWANDSKSLLLIKKSR